MSSMLTRPSLSLQARQRLTLTPHLRQALHVLRCSVPELEGELARAVADNPWLEVAAEPEAFSEASGLPPAGTDWEAPEAAAPGPTLREHLLEQLRLMRLKDRERALVMLLIDELDDNGYLAPLEDVIASMPEGLQVELGEWVAALARLQTLEPAGIGARSLSECLQLQLAAQENVSAELRVCANLLVERHLERLAAGRVDKLARQLGCAPELVERAHRLLLSLDPKPGRAWSQETAAWVVPEILVRQQGESWEAYLNPATLPRLRLARVPPAPADDGVEPGEKAADPLQQWRQAQSLLSQLRQRYDTLLKVARRVVACQQAYFHEGARAMRPLVLGEVAQALGMHESTVSRATRQKYAQTARGTFELRYFFAPAVAPHAQEVCSTAVRALISEWVAQERADQPLSDGALAQRLAQEGVQIARRTVAKYREMEGIPNAYQRRARA